MQTPFNTLICEYRRRRGMSQGQLAQAARLSRTYIYHLETGQRANPSPHVARALARALELRGAERRQFFDAFYALTGEHAEDTTEERELLDFNNLAALLVHNISYPAHNLDRLWYIRSWNQAAVDLFELAAHGLFLHRAPPTHLLAIIFDPVYRARFRPWESLARRLLSDFKFNVSAYTYLPEYHTLWRDLRRLPDFTRLARATEPGGVPAPSFVFEMRHSRLGWLTLRTSLTVFSGAPEYPIVSYIPGDQAALEAFQASGWHREGPRSSGD
ncbi:MAG TPA: helix-turn-helix domain-containing protein [Ktedonobacterales bacterium]|jgi:transcriptional regulator with XRE-family HTH domain